MVTLARSLALAVFALLVSAAPGHAACDPTTDPDKTDIANARAAVAFHCNQFCFEQSRGAYVSCAAQQANAVLKNNSCAGAVKQCAAHSICGKFSSKVTCCRTNADGKTRCSIKKFAAACTPPPGGTACVGHFYSCCDACSATGCSPRPACGSADAPTCDGTCPSGEACSWFGGPCSCVPTCILSGAPTCGGACPTGQVCSQVFTGCGCVPSDTCIISQAPACGGTCPTGQTCRVSGNVCVCGSPSGAFLDESF
jgi:hypothetical protein